MNFRPSLPLLLASATLLLCACQPPTPVAGTAPVSSPEPGPNFRNGPAWNDPASGTTRIASPGGGLPASWHGARAPAAPIMGGQASLSNPAQAAAAPSQDRFGHGDPANPARANFGQIAQAPPPTGTHGGQWQGGGMTHIPIPSTAADGRWQAGNANDVQAQPAGADAQWQGAGATPMRGQPGANGGAWQDLPPARQQAMTPEQQEAFLQRAEIERHRAHDDVIQRIRGDEVSEE